MSQQAAERLNHPGLTREQDFSSVLIRFYRRPTKKRRAIFSLANQFQIPLAAALLLSNKKYTRYLTALEKDGFRVQELYVPEGDDSFILKITDSASSGFSAKVQIFRAKSHCLLEQNGALPVPLSQTLERISQENMAERKAELKSPRMCLVKGHTLS